MGLCIYHLNTLTIATLYFAVSIFKDKLKNNNNLGYIHNDLLCIIKINENY